MDMAIAVKVTATPDNSRLVRHSDRSFLARPSVMQRAEGKYLEPFMAQLRMSGAVFGDNINEALDGGITRNFRTQDRIKLRLPTRFRLPQQFNHHDDA
jgi:hypothetical protein